MITSGSGAGAHDDDRGDAAHYAHSSEHDQAEEHDHQSTHGHSHAVGHDGAHEHGHVHATGVKGFICWLLVPHTHDAHDSIDDGCPADRCRDHQWLGGVVG